MRLGAREEWEGSSHISYNPVDHLLIFTHFFLAMIDRTLLLSNYLGNSFLQTEQPPKSEFPSHSSLDQSLLYIVYCISS